MKPNVMWYAIFIIISVRFCLGKIYFWLRILNLGFLGNSKTSPNNYLVKIKVKGNINMEINNPWNCQEITIFKFYKIEAFEISYKIFNVFVHVNEMALSKHIFTNFLILDLKIMSIKLCVGLHLIFVHISMCKNPQLEMNFILFIHNTKAF